MARKSEKEKAAELEAAKTEGVKADKVAEKEKASAAKAAVAAAEAADAAAKAAAEELEQNRLPNYRVAEDWKGSIGGSIGTLTKGKIVNPRYYGGAGGIAKLQDSGVKLEEVKQ